MLLACRTIQHHDLHSSIWVVNCSFQYSLAWSNKSSDNQSFVKHTSYHIIKIIRKADVLQVSDHHKILRQIFLGTKSNFSNLALRIFFGVWSRKNGYKYYVYFPAESCSVVRIWKFCSYSSAAPKRRLLAERLEGCTFQGVFLLEAGSRLQLSPCFPLVF